MTAKPLVRQSSTGSPTINDIARLAGVSKKTVSRVLNDEAGVSPENRDRIKGIMRDHGYAPNRGARALASSKSFLVGLAFNNPNPGFVMNVLRGVQEVTEAEGFEVVMHSGGAEPGDPAEHTLAFLRRSACDAIILTPPLSESADLIAALSSVKQRVVRIAGDDLNSPIMQVKYDDRSAAQSITHRLITHGRKRVAFIGGPIASGATRRRLAGYKDALELSGIPHQTELVEFAEFTFASGVDAANRLLGLERHPTAIVCANDEMASGVLHSVRNHGLAVPDDVAVTGFDDSLLAQQVWPTLTSVRQPIHDMGRRAAELALGLRDLEMPGMPDEFGHEIKERASTAFE